jgi:hypothetical protein
VSSAVPVNNGVGSFVQVPVVGVVMTGWSTRVITMGVLKADSAPAEFVTLAAR